MEGKNKVSCKNVLGQTICKVGSAVILPKNPVTVTIHTSTDCSWCKKEINSFKKKARKLNGFVKTVVSNVEDSRDIDFNDLGVFPVANFGNGVFERGRISKMEEGDILGRAIEAARNGEMIKSYQGKSTTTA